MVLLPRVQRLLSAADGGASICAGGYNPFSEAGSAPISQACRDYITAPTRSRTEISQTIVEGSFNGHVFEMPAGPVMFAATRFGCSTEEMPG